MCTKANDDQHRRFFMGSPDGPKHAQKLLDDCLSCLSWLQQPPHSASQDEADQNLKTDQEVEQELQKKAYELYMGLTGRNPVQEIERLIQGIRNIDEVHDEAPLLSWRVKKGELLSDEKIGMIQTFWHAYNYWLFDTMQDAIDGAKS